MSINYKCCGTEGSLVRPLMSAVTSRGNPPSPFPEPDRQLPPSSRPPSLLLPKSKAALTILFWNAVVGFTYAIVIFAALGWPLSVKSVPFAHIVFFFLCTYSAIALIQVLFYPVGGLIADLCCGRYKTVLCSMVSIWAGYVFVSLIAIVYLSSHMHTRYVQPLLWALATPMALLLVTGFTSFQANAVQFGLDQLLDVSSKELSVFLHWYVWMDAVGTFMTRLLGAAVLCSIKGRFPEVMSYSPFPVLVFMIVLVVFTYYKRQWFHCEPRTHNPYGMVYHVLKFVARHNRPRRPPSAFTYCDDEIPTRMEFAKQRFGGPFTTETVEDVKTFLRILVMLLAIGPAFALHVPTIYVFPLLGIHVGPNQSLTVSCTVDWLLVQSNNLSYAFTIVLMPLYIIFIRPCATRYLRILYRLGIGIGLLVASVLSMLLVEGLAHHHAHRNNLNTSCIFIEEYREQHFSQTLNFHTPALIIPNLLTGIGVPIVFTTILEFISAQSPHTMKGLLLGVYYAIRGIFIIVGCVMVVPFAVEHLWKDHTGKVINCGFYYYLVSGVYGALSLTLFLLAAKWYQYRVREDRPYAPTYVENYYARYATSAQTTAYSPDEREGERLLSHGHSDYGTVDDDNVNL